MTRLFDDPTTFMEDMLEGFVAAHSDKVMQVPGGVVRAQESSSRKVSVIVGGGCGHYPAFAGLVGAGFADGAIVGNIFTSPSAADAYSVGLNANAGAGVIITAGNYAGDVMHFTEAAEKLVADGIPAEVFFVTDDIASATVDEISKRRGIAGNFFVFKALSAAAEQGKTLSEVLAVGQKANAATRTLGVAFAGCTLPGASHPLFNVPAGQMSIGLGIHGEPGISDIPTPTASELAKTLVDGLLPELGLSAGDRVAVILNGLGATKYEELFVVYRQVAKLLGDLGLVLVEPEVGELVTSLDMAGCSLTISKLDQELEQYWKASANTPAYRKGVTEQSLIQRKRIETPIQSSTDFSQQEQLKIAPSTNASRKAAKTVAKIFENMRIALVSAEVELGELDAIAGDGDHGRGMAKGVIAAEAAARTSVEQGLGVQQLLVSCGTQWAAKAGGTSGALWGAGLKRIGNSLGNDFEELSALAVLKALQEGFNAIVELGKASLGDKTMLDAYNPFLQSLEIQLASGNSLATSFDVAAMAAKKAAQQTASLIPKIGRARPLAEKSIGTADPGAISLAMCLETVSKVLKTESEEK